MEKWAENIKAVQDERIQLAIIAANNHYAGFALIKPTFTVAAYHKSFYKFCFLYSGLPPHARKYITSDLNLLSSEVTNRTTGSSSAFSIDYLTEHLKTPKSKC